MSQKPRLSKQDRPASLNSCSALRSLLLVSSALALIFFTLAIPLLFPTVALAQQPTRVDSILIRKKDHLLQLLAGGKVIRSYHVALGRGGLAPKLKEGDGLTPEGRYTVDARNANSHYHKALHLSYPSNADRGRSAKAGVPPGGAIMIHGLPNGMGYIGSAHRFYDWTLGCIAVTDAEIDEIWEIVPVGTPVEIQP